MKFDTEDPWLVIMLCCSKYGFKAVATLLLVLISCLINHFTQQNKLDFKKFGNFWSSLRKEKRSATADFTMFMLRIKTSKKQHRYKPNMKQKVWKNANLLGAIRQACFEHMPPKSCNMQESSLNKFVKTSWTEQGHTRVPCISFHIHLSKIPS